MEQIPFYPVVLALVYLANVAIAYQVAPQSAARTVVIGVLVAAGMTVGLALLLRDRHRGALAAAALIVVAVSALTPLFLVALAVAILVAVLAYERTRGPIPLRRVTVACNVVVLGLLLLLIARAVLTGAVEQAAMDLRPGDRANAATAIAAATDPDVYILLLDGHPRADMLEKTFHYDLSPFVDGLTARGFHVAPRSHSSYGFTEGTLTSMFQMRHLDEIPALEPVIAGVIPGWASWRDLIGSGAALQAFRERGYEIIVGSSGFEGVSIRSADTFVDSDAVNEYESTVIRLLGLPAIIDRIAPTLLTSSVAKRIEDDLAIPAALAREPRSPTDPPRLVFVHVPSPHAPLIWRADGSLVPALVDHLFAYDASLGIDAFKQAYDENLAQLDRRVLAAIEDLDAVPSDRPRDVIVMSDHGTRTYVDPDLELARREHVANFFASKMSDGSDPFGDTPATINVFPILLDHLFDAEVPLQADRIRVSDAVDPWHWVEIPPDQ